MGRKMQNARNVTRHEKLSLHRNIQYKSNTWMMKNREKNIYTSRQLANIHNIHSSNLYVASFIAFFLFCFDLLFIAYK